MAYTKVDLGHFDQDVSSDVTANDSDKTITVTSGEIWHVHSIRVNLVATATVGTRTLSIIVKDSTPSTVFTFNISNNSATASQNMTWNFYPAAVTVAPASASTEGTQALPDLWLPAGWGLNILDSAGIDPAADDMSIWVFRTAYKV